jgi:hypothetical protein
MRSYKRDASAARWFVDASCKLELTITGDELFRIGCKAVLKRLKVAAWLRSDGRLAAVAMHFESSGEVLEHFVFDCRTIMRLQALGQCLFDERHEATFQFLGQLQFIAFADSFGARQAPMAAVSLQKPGGGAPAFALMNVLNRCESGFQSTNADGFGKARVALSGVKDGAARDSDHACGLGNVASQAQKRAEFVTFGRAECDRAAAANDGRFGDRAGHTRALDKGLFETNVHYNRKVAQLSSTP